jgi:uncharacterized membrane protein YedE/YeeE
MIVDQIPWYIGGPMLGLCVVALRLLINERLGVTGGYAEVVDRVGRGRVDLDWRGWLIVGVFAGGALFAVVAGPVFEGYGWLTDTFDSTVVIGALLLVAGVLIGFGARTAGGCTSGNGLSGTSMTSPAAVAATATFFGTAIAVSFVIEASI